MVRRACHPRSLYTLGFTKIHGERWRPVVMHEETAAFVGSCSLMCRTQQRCYRAAGSPDRGVTRLTWSSSCSEGSISGTSTSSPSHNSVRLPWQAPPDLDQRNRPRTVHGMGQGSIPRTERNAPAPRSPIPSQVEESSGSRHGSTGLSSTMRMRRLRLSLDTRHSSPGPSPTPSG